MILNLRKDNKEEEEKNINSSGKNNQSGDSEKVKGSRRKKERSQPWGKKERVIVSLLLLITIGSSVVLAFSARSWKLPGLPRIQLPEISLFKEETIIIKKDMNQSPEELSIVRQFEDKTKGLSGVYGLYVINLEDSTHMGVYKDEKFDAASLVKLPVMAAMLQEAEFGRIDMEEEYELKESDKTAGSGSLYSKPTGYVVTYGELVKLMGKESDNTAFVISKNILGEEKIEKVQEQFGMMATSIKDNDTTPADIASFFEKIYKNEVLTRPNSERIIEYLTDTAYEEWLPAGIPEDVVVSHKYGREVHTVNDAGIVYADKPYIVVILTKGVVESEADEIFSELSKTIYDNIQKD